jgi:hypothetical protein
LTILQNCHLNIAWDKDIRFPENDIISLKVFLLIQSNSTQSCATAKVLGGTWSVESKKTE